VSGNSTGDRVTRDDEEPEPAARRLWLGELSGLRLGDAPGEFEGRMGHERGMRFSPNMSNESSCGDSERFRVLRLTCSPGPGMVGEGNRGRPLLGNGEQVWIGPIRQA